MFENIIFIKCTTYIKASLMIGNIIYYIDWEKGVSETTFIDEDDKYILTDSAPSFEEI